MAVQLMKYTDLMAKIDEKFKDRDNRITRLEGIHLEIWKTLCEQKMRIDNIANTVDNHDQTLDELIVISNADDEKENEEHDEEDETKDDDVCDKEECTCDAVDIEEELKKFLQGFSYKPKKKS